MTETILNALKAALDKEGIKYRYFEKDEKEFVFAPTIYISYYDQIENPTEEERKAFFPYIRVTRDEATEKYYVRDTGWCYIENSLERLMKAIRECIRCGERDAKIITCTEDTMHRLKRHMSRL